VQIENGRNNQGKERISIIKSWRQGGHLATKPLLRKNSCTINKQNGYITRCRLTSGNCPTLPQCGIKGVDLYGLYSRDVNDDDVEDKTT